MAFVKQEEDEGSKLASITDPLANTPRAPGQAGSGFGYTPTTSHRWPNHKTFANAGVEKNRDRAGRIPEPLGGLGQMSALNNEPPTQQEYEVVDRTALVKKEEDAGENRLALKYAPQSVTVDAGSLGPFVKVEAAQPAAELTFYTGGPPQVRTTDVSSRFPQTLGVDESRLEIVDPLRMLTHLRYPYQENAAYKDSLVVAVKGVHPGYEGGTRRRSPSAYGVFFGPNSDMNQSGLIEDGTNTIRRAELYAAAAGVKAVRELCESVLKNVPAGVDHGIKHLVIKSSEEYVVKGIAGGDAGQRPWIMNWEENGFVTQEGVRVQNRELWIELAKEVRTLRWLGVTVQFWEVSEWRNQEASGLAERHAGFGRGLGLAGFERFITSQPPLDAVDHSLSQLLALAERFITPASQPFMEARGRRWRNNSRR